MNISQPVASSIEAVHFNFLSSEEIKSLSVKRITNPTTFDALLHPIPGGLYDTALGAFLDNPCSTCHLNIHSCPGHCGHIELPVHTYHCVFMDQAYRLLRAQCVYCNRLKMAQVEVNRFCCKLRLIRCGLLKEAEELEDVGLKGKVTNGLAEEAEPESSESEDDKISNLMEQRRAFVKRCIRRAGGDRKNPETSVNRSEAVTEARKAVIREFQRDLLKSRKCAHCQGISPGYRKNKYTSIFRKPLSAKDRAKNVQAGFKSFENPLAALNKIQKEQDRKLRKYAERRAAKRHDNAMHIDEGVADLDDSSSNEGIDEPETLDVYSHDLEEESEDSEDDEEDQNLEDMEAGRPALHTEARIAKAKKRKRTVEQGQVYVNANEMHASLIHLFEKEREIMSLVYNCAGASDEPNPPSADMFFIQYLLVPPNKYRKEQKTGPEEISESPDNESYRKILSACEDLYTIRQEIQGHVDETRRRVRTYDDLQTSWLLLQDMVNSLIDRDRNPTKGLASLRNPEGIKQKLEKKEGMFRMNIMGKRVNFAARSVISPDPNIETNQIGIPPVFAKKLTYPEPVTSHTFHELKQAVINGPEKWPGAISIEYETGQVINLRQKNNDERLALANQLLSVSNPSMTGNRNKKVHRHLNNGDIVIMNRQPTLHKPSMMAHRARVLPGEKTIRMHYANCNAYNADFDGDEMNMHFPQNEIARAEALQIADTDHQYLSATAGQPLRGLIQDHISVSVWLTCQDTFFTLEEYQELLYSSLRPEDNHTNSDRIQTVEPAIFKPISLWTGKQLINTILKNIKPESHAGLALHSKSSTPSDRWGPGSHEGNVVFKDGELCTGILDKSQIGPKSGGFIHTVYEAYGHTIAGKLISVLGRLLTKLLNIRAFSCGVEDLLLTDLGESTRAKILTGADLLGLEVASRYVSLENSNSGPADEELLSRLEAVLRDDEKQSGLDRVMTAQNATLSSEITIGCLPVGLLKSFPKNQMQAMTTSGAKGTPVNANLISCSLGQQILEGRRVPTMISGKTLPSFGAFESSIRAGGYIVDRFLTGVRPQEYYFHAMAGREGLIDTAVKTSRSGYLQRCLMKGMEGLRVEYDTTVRDADGTIIQSLYGEDGLDITRQASLVDFKFIASNFLSLYASLNVREESSRVISPEAQAGNKKALKRLRKYGNAADIIDPVISQLSPATFAGSTSEKYYSASRKYLDENPDMLIRLKKQDAKERFGFFFLESDSVNRKFLENVLDLNYLKAVIQPGEAVGIIAAQSVGEPSTQMTLNTFHLAGHSSKNVTLGIPRLREILMTASMSIKTPTMSLHLRPEISVESGKRFAKEISKHALAEVIDSTSIKEQTGEGIFPDARIYNIRFDFYPAEECIEEYDITTADVARTIERKFLPELQKAVNGALKKRGQDKSLKSVGNSDARPNVGESVGKTKEDTAQPDGEEDGGDSDDDGNGDEDATTAKRKSNRDEGTTYEDPDEEEEQMTEAGAREAAAESESESEDSTYGGSPREREESSFDDKEASSKSTKHAAQDRESRIKDKFPHVTSFVFDDRHGSSCSIELQYPTTTAKLLLLSLVNHAARSALIQSIPGISSCTLTTAKALESKTSVGSIEDNWSSGGVVLTEGANLTAMCSDYQHMIDPDRLTTNDIGAMLRLYGVEAARATIIRELNSVFKGHSIDVDMRHLTLVADYMTRGGSFSPFSRMGMRDKSSPFAKMSFETTVGFLRDAVCEGDTDDLRNPSARITMGKVSKVGTGMFDVLMPVT